VIKTHETGKARNVSIILNAPGENEVLFSRNSKFVITATDLSNPETVFTYMDELPNDTDKDLDLCGVYYRNF